MKIVKIEIEAFGPILNKSFELGDAISVIRGDNESGKSSLLLFIKFALYGLAKKTRGVLVSEADRAISRETDKAAGSMTVMHNSTLYRIDRRLIRGARAVQDKLSVTDLNTGLPLSLSVSPGEYFLGVPVEVFESSCFISQLGASSIKGEETGTALQNLLSNADESIDTKRILKLLESARINYLHKDARGGSIFDLEEKKAALESRYTAAVDANCTTEQLKSDHARLEEKISQVSQKQRIADELYSKINLLSAIRLFDRLHEYEAKREEYRAALEKTGENVKKDDKLPDRAFLARLKTVRDELWIRKNDYADATAHYEKQAAACARQKFSEELDGRIAELGGFESVQAKITAFASRSRGALITAIILGILFALTAGIGALFLTVIVRLAVAVALFGASAVFAAATVFALISKAKHRRALNELCAVFSSDSAHIFGRLSEIMAQKQSSDEREKALRTERGELSFKEKLLSESVKNASSAALPFFSVNEADPDKLTELLDGLIADVSELFRIREELSSRISLLDDKIKELSADLSDYNEHQIRRKVSPEILAMSDAEIQNAKKEKSYHDLQLKALTDKKLSVERALLERKYSTESPFEISAALSETCEQIESQKEKYRAVCTAIEAINTATVNMRNTLAPKIRALSNEYMSRITDGKYDSVGISDSLELSMSDKGFSYPAEAFSTGTKDAAFLTVRLSLLKLLPCDEIPPMLMDESFAMIDDTRAERMLSLLSEHSADGGQCIIFTCHDREERLLDGAGIKYSCVLM